MCTEILDRQTPFAQPGLERFLELHPAMVRTQGKIHGAHRTLGFCS